MASPVRSRVERFRAAHPDTTIREVLAFARENIPDRDHASQFVNYWYLLAVAGMMPASDAGVGPARRDTRPA